MEHIQQSETARASARIKALKLRQEFQDTHVLDCDAALRDLGFSAALCLPRGLGRQNQMEHNA